MRLREEKSKEKRKKKNGSDREKNER